MSSEAIQRLRQRFEMELQRNPTLYHEIDVTRVRTEEWQIKRFLLDRSHNEDLAFEALLKALQWKKEFGLHDRTDQYFPKEFWELNGVEINGRDRQNRVIQWEVYRNQRIFKEIQQLVRNFIAHNMERVDRAAGENGFILIMDITGAGIPNVNLDLIKFKIQTIQHYPCGFRQLLMVNIPQLLEPVINIITGYMSPQIRALMTIVGQTELEQYIPLEHIPVWNGGKREKQDFPGQLVPMDQCMDELGLSEKFIHSFYNLYKLPRTLVHIEEPMEE